MKQEMWNQLFLAMNVPRMLAPGRVERYYVARTGPLPDDEALHAIGASVEAEVFARIQRHLSFNTPTELALLRPSVELCRLDDLHLVVRMEHCAPRDGENIGDADMISQAGVIRSLDAHIRIEELQGIPRERWFFLKDGA